MTDRTEPSDADDVLEAAERRARALVERDEASLRALMHPSFGWRSHRGDHFDLDAYLASNLGRLQWRVQTLDEVRVDVVGDTAVLSCVVTDVIAVDGADQTFRMPMTQTWVREEGRWRLLAGHAGPRLNTPQ